MNARLNSEPPSYLTVKPEACRELIHEHLSLVVAHTHKGMISAEIADDYGFEQDLRHAASHLRVALDVFKNLKEAKGGHS